VLWVSAENRGELDHSLGQGDAVHYCQHLLLIRRKTTSPVICLVLIHLQQSIQAFHSHPTLCQVLTVSAGTPCLVPHDSYCPQLQSRRPMSPWRRYKDGHCSYYGKEVPCPYDDEVREPEHHTERSTERNSGPHAREQPRDQHREQPRDQHREQPRDQHREQPREQASEQGSWQWHDSRQAYGDMFVPRAQAKMQQMQQEADAPRDSDANAAVQSAEPESAEEWHSVMGQAVSEQSTTEQAVDEQSAIEQSAGEPAAALRHSKATDSEPSRWAWWCVHSLCHYGFYLCQYFSEVGMQR
jgi:hypothetical protein